MYKIPFLFNKEFPNDKLVIKMIDDSHNPVLCIFVYTSKDGFEANRKLDLIEESFYDGGDCLNKILLSVGFK